MLMKSSPSWSATLRKAKPVDIHRIVKVTFEKLGRALEYLLTGQSEFKIHTSEFAANDIVKDPVTAKKILEQIKVVLFEKFAIKIHRPIVIELIKDDKKWDYGFSWFAESLGKYKSYELIDEKYHMIYILSGLRKERFKAILAHEMTHAYQRENELFIDNRVFREGLARWIEYKILLQEGEELEARKLLNIKHWIYGRGINRLIQLEKDTGEKELVSKLAVMHRKKPYLKTNAAT